MKNSKTRGRLRNSSTKRSFSFREIFVGGVINQSNAIINVNSLRNPMKNGEFLYFFLEISIRGVGFQKQPITEGVISRER